MSGTSAQPPAEDARGQKSERFGDEHTEPLLPTGGWPELPPASAGEGTQRRAPEEELLLLPAPPPPRSPLLLPPGAAPAGAEPGLIAPAQAPLLLPPPERKVNLWRGTRRWTLLILAVSLLLLVVCGLPVWTLGLWTAWANASAAPPPLVGTLNPGGSAGYAVGWSPDGRYLAEQVSLASGDAVVLWDVQTRQEVRRFTGADGGKALAWSPDGQWLATTDGVATLLWPTAEVETAGGFLTPSARLAAPDASQAITGLAWSQDGRTLAVVDEGGLGVWQEQPGGGWKQIHYFVDGPCATIACGRGVLWSPDGRWLAVWPWHGKHGSSGVGVWNAATWQEAVLLEASAGLTWSPDSAALVVRDADETTLSGVRTSDWKAAWTIDPNGDVHQGYRVYPEAAGWSPDGKWLVGSLDGWVDLWPTETRKSAWVWEEQDQSQGVYAATSLTWSPDGRTLAVTTDGLGRVLLYDLSNPSPPWAGPPLF